MARIALKHLTKKFPGGVLAVDHVDLDIDEHEFLCLLGPSGCGKTTTLRCIAGLEEPTDGEIWIDDDRMYGAGRAVPPERRDVGMIFQSYAIWPHMSVFDNVAFGLTLKKVSQDDLKRRVHEVLELVGLGHLADRYATDLSGGQQQRVAVARSVVLEPRVLLFDEPLSNLDAKLREHMRFELRRLQKSLGTTAVYVTHDQEEAMAIADRIAIMNHGKIVQIGSPEDLYLRPANSFVAGFIGMTSLISGTVVERSADTMIVETEKGIRIHAPADPNIGDERHVMLSIRPEAVNVVPGQGDGTAPTQPNTWDGTIKDVVFLGNSVDLVADIAGLELRVQNNSSARRDWKSVAGVARFHVDPDQIVVIPNAEGLSVEEVEALKRNEDVAPTRT